MKLSWVYHEVTFPELCTTGVHSFLRDEEDKEDLFTWMLDFVTDIFTPLMPSSVLDRFVISQWGTGGGFTGWHQIDTREGGSLAFGSGDPLPYQDAWVWGYRNSSESAINLGRRRNRSYVGPIKKSLCSTDGRMTDGFRDSMVTALVLKDTELKAVLPATGFEDLCGFAPVSAAEGVIMNGETVVCGRRFDTMRSRAQKTPEENHFGDIS